MSVVTYVHTATKEDPFTLGDLRSLVQQLDGAPDDLPVCGLVTIGGKLKRVSVEVPSE